MSTIDGLIERLAAAPRLLVACDFDGVLAPLVGDPERAAADAEAATALNALASLPFTDVAILSGRALGSLRRLCSTIDARVKLVGSHGAEFSTDAVAALAPQTAATRQRLVELLMAAARGDNGFLVEEKPAGVALHYRLADPAAASAAVDRLVAVAADEPGVHVRHGKKVVEFSLVAADKGTALQRLKAESAAAATLFVGDDLTDEDGFAVLADADAGVKVGPGESRAALRVDDPAAVARMLASLADRRTASVLGAAVAPIDRLALLSDQRTVALVTPTARVVWLCLPRLDSPALFAELLGGAEAGHFEIAPADAAAAGTQAYLGDSFVLQTRWPGLTVTDYFDCTGGLAFQRAGRHDLVRVVEGRGRVRVRFAPRLDFGRRETRLSPIDGGLRIDGTIDPIVLSSPGVDWRINDAPPHQSAVAEFELGEQPLVFEMRYGSANLGSMAVAEPTRRSRVSGFWGIWASQLRIPPLHEAAVRRSALVIKALCYGPTGAIAAAATTSLPEAVGGPRNWDYRFCWPRDAAVAAGALVLLGSHGPAMRLLDWLLGVVDHCESPDRLRPLYTVTAGHLSPEAEIGELPGYRGSRPVRINNAAADQIQLDVFGPIVQLVALLAEGGAPVTPDHWRLVHAMTEAVARRWQEADHGIWEVRLSRRHYLHSKVMCWLAVDRAIGVAAYLRRETPPGWWELREAIRADVLEHGYNPACRAFTSWYGSDEPDAAALWVGLSGLLPPDDPRFAATVEFVERRLRSGVGVRRYQFDDGLPGREGSFLLCTTWLIEALALLGRADEARALLAQYVDLCGETGLLAEEYDVDQRVVLGNYPQLYSHAGLIAAAVRLAGGASHRGSTGRTAAP